MKSPTKIFLLGLFSLTIFAGCSLQDIKGISTANTCDRLTIEISNEFKKANFCETDNDCVILETTAPCNCLNVGNKNADLSVVNELMNEFYDKGTCPICYVNCPMIPEGHKVVCEQSKCVEKWPTS